MNINSIQCVFMAMEGILLRFKNGWRAYIWQVSDDIRSIRELRQMRNGAFRCVKEISTTGILKNNQTNNNNNNKHKANLGYLRLVLQSADDLWYKRLKEIL